MAKKTKEEVKHTCQECKYSKVHKDDRHIAHDGSYICIECPFDKYIRPKSMAACRHFVGKHVVRR